MPDAEYREYDDQIWPYQPHRSTWRKLARRVSRPAELDLYPDHPQPFPSPPPVDPWACDRERHDTLRRLFLTGATND